MKQYLEVVFKGQLAKPIWLHFWRKKTLNWESYIAKKRHGWSSLIEALSGYQLAFIHPTPSSKVAFSKSIGPEKDLGYEKKSSKYKPSQQPYDLILKTVDSYLSEFAVIWASEILNALYIGLPPSLLNTMKVVLLRHVYVCCISS